MSTFLQPSYSYFPSSSTIQLLLMFFSISGISCSRLRFSLLSWDGSPTCSQPTFSSILFPTSFVIPPHLPNIPLSWSFTSSSLFGLLFFPSRCFPWFLSFVLHVPLLNLIPNFHILSHDRAHLWYWQRGETEMHSPMINNRMLMYLKAILNIIRIKI